VFTAAFMSGYSNVPATISRFIGVKMGKRVFPSTGKGAHITVVRIEAIVDMPVEAARPMKPWSRSNEDTAGEPVGSVIPVGGTIIGRIVKVTIGTVRSQPDTRDDLGRIGVRDDTPTGQGDRAGQNSDCVNPLHGDFLLFGPQRITVLPSIQHVP
jgi:hypothetical protein